MSGLRRAMSGFWRTAGEGGAGARKGERSSSGQALAEMALVVPALLLLIFGIVEIGSAWRSYQVITNAAREGARRAVMPPDPGLVDPTEPAVLAIVEDVMTSGGLDFDPSYVSFSCNGSAGLCEGVRGAAEEVRIDYPYEFVFLGPLADLACGAGCDGSGFGTITLTASSVMRSEG